MTIAKELDAVLFADTPQQPPGDLRDPYSDWARLRETQPVLVEHRFGPDNPPAVFVFRYADIVSVLRNNAVFSSKINVENVAAGELVLLGIDEPAHMRYRMLAAPSLTPRLVATWDGLLIDTVNALIDEFFDDGRAELVRQLFWAYPARVVSRIIGLPSEDCDQFQQWALDINGTFADREAGTRAGRELRDYLEPWVTGRRQPPVDSILHALQQAELDGDRLTEEEIYAFLLLLVPAGVDTSYRGLGNLLYHLLRRPDLLERVRADRGLIPQAIEETMRFEPPNMATFRTPLVDAEIAGVPVPAGAAVCLVNASANRDPAFVSHPEVFDIDRPGAARHVTFGFGVHTCLGLHLARREMKVALEVLLDRLPGLRWDEDAARELDAHVSGKQFRSPTAAPVLWDV